MNYVIKLGERMEQGAVIQFVLFVLSQLSHDFQISQKLLGIQSFLSLQSQLSLPWNVKYVVNVLDNLLLLPSTDNCSILYPPMICGKEVQELTSTSPLVLIWTPLMCHIPKLGLDLLLRNDMFEVMIWLQVLIYIAHNT